MGNQDERKEAVKEALKEWLDEKFTVFGKWSAGAFSALAFAAVTYLILKMNGWVRH